MATESDSTTRESPQILRHGFLDMQVCVPAGWSDEEVVRFGEGECPSGTTLGWKVRTNEDLLAGDPARNPCAERDGFVHIMLDA